jgi:hypothetical protein
MIVVPSFLPSLPLSLSLCVSLSDSLSLYLDLSLSLILCLSLTVSPVTLSLSDSFSLCPFQAAVAVKEIAMIVVQKWGKIEKLFKAILDQAKDESAKLQVV